MSAHDLVTRLNLLAAEFGYRVDYLEEVRRAPWEKFPTRTYTWALVTRHSPKPRGESELEGPRFTCSHFSLPTSVRSRKFRELNIWASNIAKYMRNQK